MWPSPLKLFLDIESEDDLQRNRAAASSENDGNRNPVEEETVVAQRPWLTSASEARVVREKPSTKIAYSISVFRRPSFSVDLDRLRSTTSDIYPRSPWLALARVSKTPVFEPVPRPLLSVAGIRSSWSVGSAREDPVGAASFESALPTVMTPSAQRFAAAAVPTAQSGRQDMCCNFCKRNGETKRYYNSHILLDRQGKVQCPVLRSYICPICRATGDNAHTVSYCPFSKGESTVTAARTPRKSCGCKRNCRHGFVKRH